MDEFVGFNFEWLCFFCVICKLIVIFVDLEYLKCDKCMIVVEIED